MIYSGSGFRGCINYVSGKAGSEHIGGTMAGENSRELAAESRITRDRIRHIEEPVKHFVLSAEPGEKWTKNDCLKIADDYMNRMGYARAQYTVWKHNDTDIDHIHIVALRSEIDGKIVDRWKEKERSISAARSIEKSYNLRQYQSKSEKEVHRRQSTLGEYRHLERTGIPSAKQQMQEISSKYIGSSDWVIYRESLRRDGVKLGGIYSNKGTLIDFRYTKDGVSIRGRSLGKSFTMKSLQERGMIPDFNYLSATLGKDLNLRDQQKVIQAKQENARRDDHISKIRQLTKDIENLKNEMKYNREELSYKQKIFRSQQQKLSEAIKEIERREAIALQQLGHAQAKRNYLAITRPEKTELRQEKRQFRDSERQARRVHTEREVDLRERSYQIEVRLCTAKHENFGTVWGNEHQAALKEIDLRLAADMERLAKRVEESTSKRTIWIRKEDELARSKRFAIVAPAVLKAGFREISKNLQNTGTLELISSARRALTERSEEARRSFREQAKSWVAGVRENLARSYREVKQAFSRARESADWLSEATRARAIRASAERVTTKSMLDRATASKVTPTIGPAIPPMDEERRERLKAILRQEFRKSDSAVEYFKGLERAGVKAHAFGRGKEVKGLVYSFEGQRASASSLGMSARDMKELRAFINRRDPRNVEKEMDRLLGRDAHGSEQERETAKTRNQDGRGRD